MMGILKSLDRGGGGRCDDFSHLRGRKETGLVFTAGALHKIVLRAFERFGPKYFRGVLADVDDLSSVNAVAQDRLGWDQAQFEEVILRCWGMSEEVQAAARWHHSPEF